MVIVIALGNGQLHISDIKLTVAINDYTLVFDIFIITIDYTFDVKHVE